MKQRAKEVSFYYLIWVACWLGIAAILNYSTQSAEGSISAHILLCITGFPLALGSLYFPNGSLEAAAIAGGLGLVQWTLLSL